MKRSSHHREKTRRTRSIFFENFELTRQEPGYCPVHTDARDEHRGGHDDRVPVPLAMAEPRHQQRRTRYDRELTTLDAQVEREQRGEKLVARQSQLLQDTGKSHPVEQTEREHEREPPWLDLIR